MSNKTILKWAGSKVRIMDKLLPHLPAGKRLVEPFAGSCAVMMNTDYESYLIADVNLDLINLYKEINSVPVGLFLCEADDWFNCHNLEEDYYSYRDIFNERHVAISSADKAHLFLYLNRHGFRGLCRYNSKGEFNVPYGDYKSVYFPKAEITAFSEKAKKAELLHLEWQDTLTLVDYGDVVYCDPPYLTWDGAFTQYHQTNFTSADHELLAVILHTLNADIGVPVTVSNSIEAKELYADLGFTIHEIYAPRSIAANGNRQPAKEIIATLRGQA
ncbi:Dam family site-specific DNA-(adenine-N6)-methyltransferase [Xenorhabdus sp. 12]|uniref:Site-specific DNA-methyltransferase (adenine-specific) n=1 Tax=Xenorhabdus santafensis TaxID=2582833 RepID=A0ABU4SA77_9GAMM|nr:Dam family site-specific DNA-(adenine-N6)-methyltransferase [Xenorhabdus sp. 12]MDX7987681.1 Dam family site-specific DNA-(adenine-N6)-methyltransferase [Xenorhabdus sp. 12]